MTSPERCGRKSPAMFFLLLGAFALWMNHNNMIRFISVDGGARRASANNETIQKEKEFSHPKLREKMEQSKHRIRNATSTGSNLMSPPPLIHILEKRFMQNQPHLVELAKARLRLFSTTCLPTIIKQTSWGKFIWVIRTDPNLDENIKRDLISLLKRSGALDEVKIPISSSTDGEEQFYGRSLTYIIGSNVNYCIDKTNAFDIRHMLRTILLSPQSIFAGRYSSIKKLLEELNSTKTSSDNSDDDALILWTRLDADDGLNLGYMEYIQSQAVRYFLPEWYAKDIVRDLIVDEDGELVWPQQQQEGGFDLTQQHSKKRNIYVPPKWTYWCVGRYIDWFITDPFHDPIHKNGTVYPSEHDYCVTPGITVALRGSINAKSVPRMSHMDIISFLHSKGAEICSRSGLSIFEEGRDDTVTGSNEKEEVDDGSCFHMVNAFHFFAALRARTPTSAGMLGVSPTNTQLEAIRRQPILTNVMWNHMVGGFGIQDESLVNTNEYFSTHIYDIAEENLRGQCLPEMPCKTSSKDLLMQYSDLKNEMKGGFDIIDGHAVHS